MGCHTVLALHHHTKPDAKNLCLSRFPHMSIHLLPTRRRPAREPLNASHQSTIIFITACTKHRQPLIHNDITHNTLRNAWLDYRDWMVGSYVLMPDHVHLLVAPSTPHPKSFRKWVAWWKRLASASLHLQEDQLWQRDIWDYRLRARDGVAEKSAYILNNPVRAGFVAMPEAWPYAGCIHRIGQ
jgi:putative transposase